MVGFAGLVTNTIAIPNGEESLTYMIALLECNYYVVTKIYVR